MVPKNDKITDRGDPCWLEERIRHLELDNHWYAAALELLADMGAALGDTPDKSEPQVILNIIYQLLTRVMPFDIAAFLLVSEENANFDLQSCVPESASDEVQIEVDALIERDEFAWAINHNQACTVSSGLSERTLLLNVLATRNRVRGMFVGAPSRSDNISEAALRLISVVLRYCAYMLESTALYALASQKKDEFESAFRVRTLELEYQFRHDTLTGLLNRAVFIDRLEQAIVSALDADRRIVVAHIDLDLFKRINESFGLAIGDQLLKQVAVRLGQVSNITRIRALPGLEQSNIVIGRLGGDEFGILLANVTRMDGVGRVMKMISTGLSPTYHLAGQDIYVGNCIGVSVYPDHGLEAGVLAKHADAAMYYAKKGGRNAIRFFTRNMEMCSSRSLLLENHLYRALRQDEFIVYYQPKVDILSERIIGGEALLRWRHPEYGMIGPLEFIRLAESSGLITPIGEWVLQTVCRQVTRWRLTGLPKVKIALNLSPRQVHQEGIVRNFLRTLNQENVSPDNFELELTETSITQDIDAAAHVLDTFHGLGFTVSIDDFGTGYSSLHLLKHMPVDTLKIDQSFTRDLTTDANDAAIISAVVAMGRNLKLNVIAEGVETRAQFDFLKSLNCREIQGYFVSRPLPAQEFEDFYRNWRGIPPSE